jgi:predicted metalloprotease
MRWKEGRRSENVEDRRRVSTGGMVVGGGIGTILLLLLATFLGINPQALLQQGQGKNQPAADQRPLNPAEEEAKEFVSVVLGDTEDVWRAVFRQLGKEYREPKLVLFTGQVRSACGFANAAVGPFYCPADQTIYLDLSFFQELKQKFGAPGDFAQAYVIAHEVGHHVQQLLGISDRVHGMQGRVSKEEYNQLSVRLELQADFLAGVWAHHAQKARQILEQGDVEEALKAATAIGDDRLQMQGRGYVVPDSFTHGTSEQRVRWFRRGLASGDINQGDTFNAEEL